MPDAMLRDAVVRSPDDASTGAPDGDPGDVDPTDARVVPPDVALPDAALPDAAPGIDSCVTACARYGSCERLDVFGDEDACLSACDRVTAGRRAVDSWFACLEVEECNLLHLCALPELVPLTCDEACGEVEACGVEHPFPDCRDECAAENQDAAFGRCAEHLYGGHCESARFWECLGDDVYTACAERCQLGVDCNSVRPEECLQACVAERFDADPLRRRRGEQKTQCVRFAVRECARIDECLNPRPFEPIVATREALCALWDGCFRGRGIEDEFEGCEQVWQFANEREMGAECLIFQLRNGCPPDPNRLLEQCLWNEDEGGGVGFGPGCPDLCEAQSLCGALPRGQNQQTCNQTCRDALQRGDNDARQRLQETFPCGVAESCEALDACLVENSPDGACAAHCDALTRCGVAPEGCGARCDQDFFRLRHVAWRACVVDAGDVCDDVAACAPAPILSCAVQCDRYLQCGRRDPNCLAQCDDLNHTDPGRAASTFACAQAALCRTGNPRVVHCLGNPASSGATCLGYCRARTGCDPDAVEALEACLIDCGQGFEGEDALRFAAAGECLSVQDPNGQCARLAPCLPDPVEVDCPAWCVPLEACALLPAQCGETCAEDALARLRAVTQLPCLADAGENCEAADACVGHTDPQPAPTAEAVCDAWAVCDLDEFFPCEEFANELGDRPDGLRCVMAQLSPCPQDPDAVFQCFDGEEGGISAGDCRQFCEAQIACGRGFGLDGLGRPCNNPDECPADNGEGGARDCTETCVNRFQRADQGERGRLSLLLACGAAQSCVDLDACLVDHTPEASCQVHCDALAACDAAAPQCRAQCADDFFRPRDEAWRRCVSAAGEDCDAAAACAPVPPLPCDVQCARFTQCGVRRGTCVDDCEDLSFHNLATAAQRLACAMSAPLCNGRQLHSVQRCWGAPHVGGKACLGFCRAQTGCDEGAVEALGACILRCGAGLTGDEGLAFAAARGCLQDADANAACPVLSACIPEPVVADCDGWCGPLGACGASPEGCADACVDDPLSRLRAVTQVPCISEADDDCDAAVACIDTSLEEEPVVDQAMFCAQHRVCGFEREIPCQDVLREFMQDEGDEGEEGQEDWLGCAFQRMFPCPEDPFEAIHACFGGNREPPELDTCARLCEAEAFCGADAGVRDCTEGCFNQVRANPQGARADGLRCRDALTCAELAACAAGGP